MKFISMRWVALAVAALTVTHSLAECSRPLKVGWEHWPPYQYVDKDRELIGLDVELLLAVAEEANCTLHFFELPWKRHLRQIEHGDIDLAMGASYDDARAEYAYFGAPFRKERVSLITLKSNADKHQIASLADIRNKKLNLGVTLGYYYGEEYKELMLDPEFKARVDELHTDQLNFIKLFRERLDAMLVDPVSIPHQLSTLQESTSVEVLFDVYSADVHLMFSKSSLDQKTVEHFNKALDRVKASGTYDKIMDRYLKLN